ncbi:hypothetical protein IV203_025736 [Nitzschia inconspicua]|uniref:Uncharacterized protein n=1 Tax=Nitzschia inconspicua TaxID=303405 RepID=A0A9K3LHN3_9STRA|nr:hypothetical protein IV203_025736 [Nitzschia inconspicua]
MTALSTSTGNDTSRTKKKKMVGSTTLSRMMSSLNNRTIKLDFRLSGVMKGGNSIIADDAKNCSSEDGDTCHTAEMSLSFDEALGSDHVEFPSIPKRSVHFSPYTTVRRTLSRHSYTKEELQDCWYQKEDYNRILSSCHRLVTKYEQCMQEKTPFKYCLRGLEHQTAVRASIRASNRFSAVEMVFAAQYKNPEDVEAIADYYRTVSSSCHLWAHCVGLKDQKVAQRYCTT